MRNLQYLALEVYKSLNEQNPTFMKEFFSYKSTDHNLRKGAMLMLPQSVGIDSWLYRGVLAWNNLPKEVKEAGTLSSFKQTLKSCSIYCQCKICR